MKLSKDARTLCRALFRLCLNKGRIQEDRVNEVVDTLLKERPRNYLQILRELTRLIRLKLAERQAEVQSALPLSPTEISRIATELRSLHGPDLGIQFKINPSLLGGLRIRIGSEVWDGTVSDRLRRILVSGQQSLPPSFQSLPRIQTSISENFKISHLAS
jgi:F-type H+-transporting ATPase subunit delta